MTTNLHSALFDAVFSDGRLSRLCRVGDAWDTNYAASESGTATGDLVLRWEQEGSVSSLTTAGKLFQVQEKEYGFIASCRAHSLSLRQQWLLEQDALLWDVEMENCSQLPITLLDVGFPWIFATRYVKDTLETYTRRAVRHSFIGGSTSFAYYCRPNGEPPYLLLTPRDGTSLEFYQCDPDTMIYTVYAHALTARQEMEGPWNLPVTGRTLAPGESAAFRFRLTWVDSHRAVRDSLAEQGLVAAEVVPGYTLPQDMAAQIFLRSSAPIEALTCEKPGAVIEPMGGARFRVSFSDVGEYRLDVTYGGGKRTILEFFSTLPLEELIGCRAKHLVEKQRYLGAAWYDGLISSWHMAFRRMTTPEDRMGLYPYAVTADDPGLCKAPFLAQKNVYRPREVEIEAVEYYIEHFVWGGLQRRDTETPHPYGIYGSDTWIENRLSGTGYGVGGAGMERMWRTFDYTHIIMLYYNMYRIAQRYPDKVRYMDAEGYLSRAYHTAMAFYEVPYNIYMRDHWAFTGWTDWAYKQGNFHELYIPLLIDDLEKEGQAGWAAQLRFRWENKVKYMLCDHPYPFGSEMYFDSTAYESTYAVARYASTHDLEADQGAFYDKNKLGPGQGAYTSHSSIGPAVIERFMERQLLANLACRGSVAPSYYLMGSDVRQQGNISYLLSYMTQMGGWAILDYALRFAPEPEECLRLGYASILASWCLIHTGEGYPWWPHPDNLGAAGWAYNPLYGPMWTMANIERGVWPLDGEIDSGFSGGLRAACSVLSRDSAFGLTVYGGELTSRCGLHTVRPMDGVRAAFHALHHLPGRLHAALSRDAFIRVTVGETLDFLQMEIENLTGDSHQTNLSLRGLVSGRYALACPEGTQQLDVAGEMELVLHMPAGCGGAWAFQKIESEVTSHEA